MPSIQCPECGKELFTSDNKGSDSFCLCEQCGREVVTVGKRVKARVKCPKCGKENSNEATV